MNKIDLCKAIQANVSKLTESENLELFKIILDTKANYTKNNNGIFLNLNWIEEELLSKINNYILFCIKSQNEISKYELMKTLLNDSINTKDSATDEDTSSVVAEPVNADTVPVSVAPKQKFSSSMKFYLLKKKFMKQNTNSNTYSDNDLTYEDYLIT